jgi:hypothetical protein
MKKLLVMTGPQGSGNHLWSKVLAETPEANGWTELSKKYWISHTKEPFSQFWRSPELFEQTCFPHDYYVTSVGCPNPAGPENISKRLPGGVTPDYLEFFKAAEQAGFTIKLAIIGRDFNILNHQQQRVRGLITTARFIEQLDLLMQYDPVFISTELLYLYKMPYIKQISKLLDFPINIGHDALEHILKDNANLKYIKSVESTPLDVEMNRNILLINRKQDA